MQHVHGPSCGCKQYIGAEDAGDLYGAIDLNGVRCLNESVPNSGKNVFKPYSDRFDKSKVVSSKEDDPELLLIIPFTSQVKIKSICVIANGQTKCPAEMHLYINENNVNFSLTDSPGIQEFPVVPNLDGRINNAVKQSKFNAVGTLIIFFKNPRESQIEIAYVQVKGEATGLKKQVVHTIYELNPNAKKLDLRELQKNNMQMH